MQGREILQRLRDRFGGAVVETHEHRGDTTLVVERAALVDLLRFCRVTPALAFDVICGPSPTGSSARCGTCSASVSRATPTPGDC